jgi:hypothetical protein
MFAIVRLNPFDPIRLAASSALEQFDQIHRTQPGYVGSIVVDASRSPPGAQSLGERGAQRGGVVGRRARGRPAPGTAHVPPI